MNWLADDPELLEFAMDAIEHWEDSAVSTDASSPFTQQEIDLLSIESSEKPLKQAKKKKNRGRRREEIITLRSQVSVLEGALGSIRLHTALTKTNTTQTVVAWEKHAQRELRARRHAEEKNKWLHSTLARHVKITQRLVRLAAMTDSVSLPLPPPRRWSDCEKSTDSPAVSVQVDDKPDLIEIQMQSNWTFASTTASDVETTLWAHFHGDHCSLTLFSVDYKIEASDETSLQSSFRGRSHDGFEFRGTRLARCSRDEAAGQFVIQVTSQTMPHGDTTEAVLDASLLLEETTMRVAYDHSINATTVAIEGQFMLHSGKVTSLQRRGLADAVSVHLKEELVKMHEDVQSRLLSEDS